MRPATNGEVNYIAKLMVEMDPTSGSASHLAGDTMAQDAMTLLTINNTPMGQSRYENDGMEEEEEFGETELKLAKRFIEIIGGADRARDLLDKVNDCEECLGMVDGDEEDEDVDMIGKISASIPSSPDMPMMNMASQFNPSSPSYSQ